MGATASLRQKSTPFGERAISSLGVLSPAEKLERYIALGDCLFATNPEARIQVLRTVADK